MSYQVLARKWRPKTFEQLVGQEAVVQALVNGLDNDRIHHGFLFTGTRGVGKTTIARILAKCLNCEGGVTSRPCGECSSCVDIDEGRFQDLLEIDAASKTQVADTRELMETVQFAPARGRYKVYLIDEVHMLSKHSFNALLKTLEEPPPHVKFVLATTDPEQIPVTVLSRCLRFSLRRLLPGEISAYLDRILADEGVEAEPAAVARIARAADGSMRDALSLLDQAIAHGGGRLQDATVAQMMGSVDHAHIAEILAALATQDAVRVLEIVGELAAQARNLERVLRDLAEVLHRMGLVQLVPDYRDPERSDWDSIVELAGELSAEDVQLFYQIAIQGRRDLGLAPDPRTGLEMTLLRMLAFRPAGAPAAAAGGGNAAERPRQARSTASRKDREVAARTAQPSGQDRGDAARPAANRRPQPRRAATQGEAGEVDWDGLIQRLDLDGPVRELARNIQFESRTGDEWRFLIPDEARHLGSTSLVEQLQTKLSSHVGHDVNLAIHKASEPVATPAAVSRQAEVRRRSEAERAIDEDPTLRSLKDRFDARILDDSNQPLQ
ncbi:MAG: DNA polymerase III subunit gamma/tau [Gammaproteobacteria bacterium]